MAQAARETTGARLYYGYVIVITSLLIMLVMHGISSSYGVFFSSFHEEFGWSRALIAGASSLAFFLMGLSAVAGGRLTDRYGPKFTMTVSALFLGIGYALMSRINAPWQLFLVYGVFIGIGNSSADVALLPTTARWFAHRRGLMTGLVKMGTGFGIFLVPLAASFLIINYSWRTAYVVLALVAIVGIMGLAQLLRPQPSRAEAASAPAGPPSLCPRATPAISLSTFQAMSTRQFWMVCAAYFLTWYATQSVMVHIAVHSVDTGLSVGQAARVIAVIGGASILGRLVMGASGDKIGNRKALMVCFVVLLAALLWLQFAHGAWMLVLFALAYGFAHGGFFSIAAPLLAELFGLTSLATILGMLFFLGQTGGAIGPIVTGLIFDLTDTYRLAFIILVVAAAVGLVLASMVKPVRACAEPL